MGKHELEEKLMQAADCFYQERNEEGVQKVLEMSTRFGQNPETAKVAAQVFDALDREDYIFAADLLQHEILEKRKI